MAYKVGFCPCCDCQIMVRDSDGRWNSFKTCFRQANLIFEDGHKVRTIICSDCLGSPDLEGIMNAITCAESLACSDDAKKILKAKGTPVSIEEYKV